MFWGKPKPKKNAETKVSGPSLYGAIKSVPVIHEAMPMDDGPSVREGSRQVLERMGGAQVIAAVIRTMMVEDRKRRRSPETEEEGPGEGS